MVSPTYWTKLSHLIRSRILLVNTKYTKIFQWSNWVLYDQNFRKEVVARPGLVWSRTDPAIFLVFIGMVKQSAAAWCRCYYSVDHISDLCGEAPRKASICSSPLQVLLPRSATTSTPLKDALFNHANICISATCVKATVAENTQKKMQSQLSSDGPEAGKATVI